MNRQELLTYDYSSESWKILQALRAGELSAREIIANNAVENLYDSRFNDSRMIAAFMAAALSPEAETFPIETKLSFLMELASFEEDERCRFFIYDAALEAAEIMRDHGENLEMAAEAAYAISHEKKYDPHMNKRALRTWASIEKIIFRMNPEEVLSRLKGIIERSNDQLMLDIAQELRRELGEKELEQVLAF